MVHKSKNKKVQLTSGAKKRRILQWCLGLLAVATFGSAIATLVYRSTQQAPQLPQPPLKELAARHGVDMGMLAQPGQLTQQPFNKVLTEQYSMITSDGQIHWDKFRPSPTEYNFGPMDREVAFAREQGMDVQAHHLVWDESDSLPKWLRNGSYSREQLLGFMKDHITTTVGRYKGQVKQWSVVNEAHSRQQHIFGLESWWVDSLGGLDHLDDAFRWAHAADPGAKLILNDFFNETETSVSNAMYDYLKGAKARGVPIHGVGIQMHMDSTYRRDKEAIKRNLQRFKQLGYEVHVTEFDMRSHKPLADAKAQTELEAKITGEVVRACVESQACASFTVFGMRDLNNFVAWASKARAGERSYLLDSRYRPKPSFYAFHEAWK